MPQNFVVCDRAQALAEMFTQILALCARAGLVSVGLVALDGARIGANAAQSANRTHEGLREEVERILAEAGRIDAAEDGSSARSVAMRLPAPLANRRSRIERLRGAAGQELEAEHAQAQAVYEENLRWRAQWEAEHARKLGGRKPMPPDPDALSKRKINTTDPDSRVLPRAGKPRCRAITLRQSLAPARPFSLPRSPSRPTWRKCLVLCKHRSEGVDVEIDLGRAEVEVVYALAKDALVDAQYRPDSLGRGVVVEQVA